MKRLTHDTLLLFFGTNNKNKKIFITYFHYKAVFPYQNYLKNSFNLRKRVSEFVSQIEETVKCYILMKLQKKKNFFLEAKITRRTIRYTTVYNMYAPVFLFFQNSIFSLSFSIAQIRSQVY